MDSVLCFGIYTYLLANDLLVDSVIHPSNKLGQEYNIFAVTESLSFVVEHRERITKSWHWLRQLVPNCDPYADKATVFEMSVAYLHHCWKHHGPLVQQINKVCISVYVKNYRLKFT